MVGALPGEEAACGGVIAAPVGPMQSWGVQSHFVVRETGLEPSKSGVVGRLARRWVARAQVPLDDLAALRMGVRVDREGRLATTFTPPKRSSREGRREGHGALHPLLPGRRSFLAGWQVIPTFLRAWTTRCAPRIGRCFWDARHLRPARPSGYARGGVSYVTRRGRWCTIPCWGGPRRKPARVRLVMEDSQGAGVRPDQPISFAERRFAPRRVRTEFVPRRR